VSTGVLLDKFTTCVIPVELIGMRPGACVPGGTAYIGRKLLKDLARGTRAPIIVRPLSGTYELIAGDAEFMAAKKQGQATITVSVAELDDVYALLLRLHEAGNRRDLNAVEEAEIIRELSREHGLTQQEIAVRCGKVQSTIANKLRLLNLPDEVLEGLRRGDIGERHARALLKVADKEKQMSVFKRCLKSRLSANEVESMCSVLSGGGRPVGKRSKLGVVKDPRIYQNALRSVVRDMQKAGLKASCEEDNSQNTWEFRVKVIISDI
jgi:ParB family chromosome partitioning protein